MGAAADVRPAVVAVVGLTGELKRGAAQACAKVREDSLRCKSGRAKRDNGCPHGKHKGFCTSCSACPHGKLKFMCKQCSPCLHGKLPQNCKHCSACPHGRVKRNCATCSGCLHGKL